MKLLLRLLIESPISGSSVPLLILYHKGTRVSWRISACPCRVLRRDPRHLGCGFNGFIPSWPPTRTAGKTESKTRGSHLGQWHQQPCSSLSSAPPARSQHSFFLIPVANTSPDTSPFPSPPSGGGIMNSKMHKKTSNDSKNYETTKIQLFSEGKPGAVNFR